MIQFTGIKQFDFQIDRFTSAFIQHPMVAQDRATIGAAITDFSSWFTWWSNKAAQYEQQQEFQIAASYYKAAMFYLEQRDKNKQLMYDRFIHCFYESYTDFDYERGQVPYEHSFLPTLLLKNPNATRTLLVIGGFDGYLEEIAGYVVDMKNTDYNILIFDGPGQGHTPAHGLTFIPNFEKPVSAVLDFYNLDSVDAIGLSWGGYLVLRAAAYEKRIKRCVTMDIFYSPMDTMRMDLGPVRFSIFNFLLNIKAEKIINRILNTIASKDPDMKWKLTNGYQLTGESTPYQLMNNLRQHTVKPILSLVTQDCLLLAGKEDQYVPYKRLYDIEKGLVNAPYIRSKLFTKETGGEQHCQVGRMDLAFAEIIDFLNN